MAKTATRKRRAESYIDQESSNVIPMPLKKSRARKQAMSTEEHSRREPATRSPLVCKTDAQKHYKHCIESSRITIGEGPAGCGKSYVALKIAARYLEEGEVDRIVVTRPAVGAEEDYGALPGDLGEKMHPWFKPALDILTLHFGKSHVEGMMKADRIVFSPLAHMRGLTFNRDFVLLDEAQNATVNQTKLLLTRLGAYSKIVLDGDITQTDIPSARSGLADAIRRFESVKEIAIARFEEKDIVRDELIKVILAAYRKPLS